MTTKSKLKSNALTYIEDNIEYPIHYFEKQGLVAIEGRLTCN